MLTQREIYNKITAKLTLKQFTAIMGGAMDYKSKCIRIKTVSKSKRVHELCDLLIQWGV